MENLLKTGRIFFALGIVFLGIQQFIYADFRPVFLPAWPVWLHWAPWAYIMGIALVTAGIFIGVGKKISRASLLLAGLFFLLFLAFHVPYVLFVDPNSPRHLGLWTNPLKELALSGSALVMAGSGSAVMGAGSGSAVISGGPGSAVISGGPGSALAIGGYPKWRRIGTIFFSIMLIAFGIDHFYYPEFVATLVPTWIPGPFFWTYFGGIALIGAGAALILGFRTRQVALLLGIMRSPASGRPWPSAASPLCYPGHQPKILNFRSGTAGQMPAYQLSA
jgi:uncharacterized membrane protein